MQAETVTSNLTSARSNSRQSGKSNWHAYVAGEFRNGYKRLLTAIRKLMNPPEQISSRITVTASYPSCACSSLEQIKAGRIQGVWLFGSIFVGVITAISRADRRHAWQNPWSSNSADSELAFSMSKRDRSRLYGYKELRGLLDEKEGSASWRGSPATARSIIAKGEPAGNADCRWPLDRQDRSSSR